MGDFAVLLPSNYMAYVLPANSTGLPTAITSKGSTVLPQGATPTLTSGDTLYITTTITSSVHLDVSSLVYLLNSQRDPKTYAAFYEGSQISGLTTILSPTHVLFVPVMLKFDNTITVEALTNTLKADFKLATTRFDPGAIKSSSTATQASVASSMVAETSSVTPRPAAPHSSTTASSGTSSQSTNVSGVSSSVSQGTLGGAVAGSIIAGLVLGAAICLCLYFCCAGRRRSPRRVAPEDGRVPADSVALTAIPDKSPRALERSLSVAGWQKHLPQEKSDRMIRSTFETLFTQVQMHVEGFYGGSTRKLSNAAIASAVRRLSGDDVLQDSALTAGDIVPVLEAVLARWIIHRISLRSAPDESLLPAEYTGVPETRQWHMESDGESKSASVGSKRGLPQAFAEWRQLTGFIRPDPQNDVKFNKTLTVKINTAVRTLSDAYSPWELPDKSGSDRVKSLQSILEEASRAGVLLFRQRSLYVFVWSGEQQVPGRPCVTPALVKELDEYGESLEPAQVLIEATWPR